MTAEAAKRTSIRAQVAAAAARRANAVALDAYAARLGLPPLSHSAYGLARLGWTARQVEQTVEQVAAWAETIDSPYLDAPLTRPAAFRGRRVTALPLRARLVRYLTNLADWPAGDRLPVAPSVTTAWMLLAVGSPTLAGCQALLNQVQAGYGALDGWSKAGVRGPLLFAAGLSIDEALRADPLGLDDGELRVLAGLRGWQIPAPSSTGWHRGA